MKLNIKTFLAKYWILMLMVAIKFALQYLLVNPTYELHRDEFLHLDQAFHLSAGYISVPPFTAFLSTIIYWLGGGLFWIRFFPALFGAATIVFAWLIVEEIDGKLPAKILTGIFLLFSVLLRINVLFQPNSFDVLVWTIIFYLLIRYIRKPNRMLLLWLGMVMALGFYNKYNVAFLVVGLIAGFLMTSQRVIFTKRGLYLAALLCVFLLLPNVIWQFRHQFPVLLHMRVLHERQLVHVERLDFLFDQIKFGLLGVLSIAALWALVFHRPFRPYRFVLFTYLVVMLLYVISRGKNYYAIGLYPVLFAIGAVYLQIVLKSWTKGVFAVLAVLNIVFIVAIVPYLMPFKSPEQIRENPEIFEKVGLLRWEDGENHALPQDFADMLGWREMAKKAAHAYQMIPKSEHPNTLVFCDNYGQTGAVNHYNRGLMPEAHSFTADYIFWLPKLDTIRNIVFVGDLPDKQIVDMFEEYRWIGRVENIFAREYGTNIYLLLGGSDAVTSFFYQEAEERKKNWDIF